MGKERDSPMDSGAIITNFKLQPRSALEKKRLIRLQTVYNKWCWEIGGGIGNISGGAWRGDI